MFKNLIKYSIRSFNRQRAYIIINILGLSIGIACSLLIAFFVLYEISYDRYNTKKDRIYNIVLNFKIGGQEVTEASSPIPAGPVMLQEFPEIEDVLRMQKTGQFKTVNYDNQNYSMENILLADSSFFNFFSIPVLKGDQWNLLNSPGKAVISESVAKRIFGIENPVDKILKLGKDTALYTVTGIMADIPENSHFKADILISFMSDPQSKSSEWGNNQLNTYLLLKPNSSYKTVEEKLHGMVLKYLGPLLQQFLNLSFDEFISKGNKWGYSLQRLTDIHLDTSVKPHFEAAGNPEFLKILGGIAILILMIAAINFTNLSTAQASRRAKEVGIKKIGGSPRGILITQFLSESIILTFVSTVFGLIIVKIIIPYFNQLLGATLKLDLFGTPYLIPSLILFSVIVGVLAGIYPAFVLSSFNPYEVLKGNVKVSMQSGRLRRVLVVFQFTVSIILIVGTILMYRQIKFMLNKDAGFNKEQLIVLENAEALGGKTHAFKDVLKTIPGVVTVTGSNSVPARSNNNNGYMVEGKKDETILLWTNWIDYDYIGTYGMTLLKGRTFNNQYSTDKEACILNEAAIKKFGIDPEKTRIMLYGDSGKVSYSPIIGVVKDFVFESLRNKVGPYIFRLKPDDNYCNYLTLKISGDNYSGTIADIGNKWKEFASDEPFKYHFLDELLEKMYIKEKQNARMAIISSLLAK